MQLLAGALLLASSSTLVMANNVLNVNPVVADADLTTHGSDFLWAAFAVMLTTALGTTVWAMFLPREFAVH